MPCLSVLAMYVSAPGSKKRKPAAKKRAVEPGLFSPNVVRANVGQASAPPPQKQACKARTAPGTAAARSIYQSQSPKSSPVLKFTALGPRIIHIHYCRHAFFRMGVSPIRKDQQANYRLRSAACRTITKPTMQAWVSWANEQRRPHWRPNRTA
ncbi:hypothetical protein IWW45_006028 [Coemansia sp. RSA 485]|nr:hypothetical protein IWW45_006028 [Coemansia sp. RSA 485]